jgi:hypothetical protein
LKLVAIVGDVEQCRMALTYEGSVISAMLDDVRLMLVKQERSNGDGRSYETVTRSTRVTGGKLKV